MTVTVHLRTYKKTSGRIVWKVSVVSDQPHATEDVHVASHTSFTKASRQAERLSQLLDVATVVDHDIHDFPKPVREDTP